MRCRVHCSIIHRTHQTNKIIFRKAHIYVHVYSFIHTSQVQAKCMQSLFVLNFTINGNPEFAFNGIYDKVYVYVYGCAAFTCIIFQVLRCCKARWFIFFLCYTLFVDAKLFAYQQHKWWSRWRRIWRQKATSKIFIPKMNKKWRVAFARFFTFLLAPVTVTMTSFNLFGIQHGHRVTR